MRTSVRARWGRARTRIVVLNAFARAFATLGPSAAQLTSRSGFVHDTSAVCTPGTPRSTPLIKADASANSGTFAGTTARAAASAASALKR